MLGIADLEKYPEISKDGMPVLGAAIVLYTKVNKIRNLILETLSKAV
jgi:hypothetical protein